MEWLWLNCQWDHSLQQTRTTTSNVNRVTGCWNRDLHRIQNLLISETNVQNTMENPLLCQEPKNYNWMRKKKSTSAKTKMNQMLKLSENFKADVMKMFQWSIQHSLEKNKKGRKSQQRNRYEEKEPSENYGNKNTTLEIKINLEDGINSRVEMTNE